MLLSLGQAVLPALFDAAKKVLPAAGDGPKRMDFAVAAARQFVRTESPQNPITDERMREVAQVVFNAWRLSRESGQPISFLSDGKLFYVVVGSVHPIPFLSEPGPVSLAAVSAAVSDRLPEVQTPLASVFKQ